MNPDVITPGRQAAGPGRSPFTHLMGAEPPDWNRP